MKKSYLSLEVICHRNCKDDEKLVFQNNEYKTKPIINRVHMSNEGILASIENQKVDLFKQLYRGIKLPEDIESFSLILTKNDNYISKNCSVSKNISSKELLRVGTNLFAYENSIKNTFLVNKEELSNILELLSIISFEYIKERNLRKSGKDSKDFYEILNEALNYKFNIVNTLKMSR